MPPLAAPDAVTPRSSPTELPGTPTPTDVGLPPIEELDDMPSHLGEGAPDFHAPHDPQEHATTPGGAAPATDATGHVDDLPAAAHAAPAEEASPGFASPSRAAASGALLELPPDQLPDGSYKPDWSRYNKAGLFNGPSSEQVTSDNTPDVAVAEAHYLTLLNTNLPDPQRRTVLLELAAMYQRYNVKPKVAATYERYAEVFPQDPIVPEIYMRLGFLYREIGAFKMALSKFYSVLNSSLAINRDQMDTYRRLSLKAQVEIADTYYVMGDYEQAAKFFLRLKRLELSENERALVDFKYAYTQFLLESYPSSITNLQAFLEAHNGHPLEAEARFLLANACKRLGQTDRALSETLTLLQKQQQSGDPLLWAYWQKRTGNQLANEFYEQGDFAKALHIYQAMLHLSDDPEWEWPVAYQIGLCFERLRMVPKSIEAYQYILGEADVYSKEGRSLPAILQDLRQQASWRLEHLQWVGRTEAEVNRVVGEG